MLNAKRDEELVSYAGCRGGLSEDFTCQVVPGRASHYAREGLHPWWACEPRRGLTGHATNRACRTLRYPQTVLARFCLRETPHPASAMCSGTQGSRGRTPP